jgi:hypothetical protein
MARALSELSNGILEQQQGNRRAGSAVVGKPG